MVLKNKIAYWNKKVRGSSFCYINDSYWFYEFLEAEKIKEAINRIEFLNKSNYVPTITKERNIILQVFKNIYDYE